MKCKGNEQSYVHPVRYTELLDDDSYIVRPTKYNQDFLVKMVKMDMVDCGATYYIRGKLIKARTFPRDFYANKLYINMYDELNQDLKTIKNDMKPEEKYPILLNNYLKIATKRRQIKVENIQKEMKNEHYKALYEEIRNYENQQNIKNINNTICIVKRKNGRLCDYYKKNEIDMDFLKNCTVTKVQEEIINKMVIRAMMEKEINKETMKDLLLYLNKQDQSITIEEEGVGILMEVLKRTMKLEERLLLINNLEQRTYINDIKNNNYEKMPASLKEAYVNYKLSKYISVKIRDWLGVNIKLDTNKVQDF